MSRNKVEKDYLNFITLFEEESSIAQNSNSKTKMPIIPKSIKRSEIYSQYRYLRKSKRSTSWGVIHKKKVTRIPPRDYANLSPTKDLSPITSLKRGQNHSLVISMSSREDQLNPYISFDNRRNSEVYWINRSIKNHKRKTTNSISAALKYKRNIKRVRSIQSIKADESTQVSLKYHDNYQSSATRDNEWRNCGTNLSGDKTKGLYSINNKRYITNINQKSLNQEYSTMVKSFKTMSTKEVR